MLGAVKCFMNFMWVLTHLHISRVFFFNFKYPLLIHFKKQILPFKSLDFYLLDSFKLGLTCKLHIDIQFMLNNFSFTISATICLAHTVCQACPEHFT